MISQLVKINPNVNYLPTAEDQSKGKGNPETFFLTLRVHDK
jgi:hypothetical protein